MTMPAQPADLNPIKLVWDELDWKSSASHLWQLLQEIYVYFSLSLSLSLSLSPLSLSLSVYIYNMYASPGKGIYGCH